jgi:hypothetical protein
VDNDLRSLLSKLISAWDKDGLEVNKGISDYHIESLEKEVNYNFDVDFKEYLRQINGLEDFEWDKELFSFWSIDRIKSEYGDCHPLELICFADYNINVCSYGFNIQDRKVYSHYQHTEGLHFISNSFTEFIDLYLNDSDCLVK